MNCEEARESFPDLAGGPADAAAARHVAECVACAREMEGFTEVLAAAARYAQNDVPDPGEAYWDGFLPAVRARLARRGAARPRARSSAVATAAAVLMAAAGAGALLLHTGPVRPGDPFAASNLRLERALDAMPDLAPEVAADMLGTDRLAGVSHIEILETIDEIGRSSRLLIDWSGDEELERMLDELTVEQATRLKADIAAERG